MMIKQLAAVCTPGSQSLDSSDLLKPLQNKLMAAKTLALQTDRRTIQTVLSSLLPFLLLHSPLGLGLQVGLCLPPWRSSASPESNRKVRNQCNPNIVARRCPASMKCIKPKLLKLTPSDITELQGVHQGNASVAFLLIVETPSQAWKDPIPN